MEIYSLKLKSSKNTNIFALSTSVGEVQIHSDIIVKYGLAVGEFDDAKFELAKQESDQIIALNLVTKFLSSSLYFLLKFSDIFFIINDAPTFSTNLLLLNI